MNKLKYQQYNGTTSGTPSEVTAMANTNLKTVKALIVADSGNTSVVSFGADGNANFDVIQPGQTYELPLASTEVADPKFFDLADLNVKSASASQAYRILYLVYV